MILGFTQKHELRVSFKKPLYFNILFSVSLITKKAKETGAISINRSQLMCRIEQKLNSDIIINTSKFINNLLINLGYKNKKFLGYIKHNHLLKIIAKKIFDV